MNKLEALVRPNTLLADFLLSVYATCGFFYVNIMAVMVDALMTRRGFSEQEAGMASAFDVYGAAAGSLLALAVVTRFHWRRASVVMIFILIGIDLVSIVIGSPLGLMSIRLLHGVVAGCLVGTAYSVFARVRSPDRTFGVLLFLQYGLAGVVIWFAPELVRQHGAYLVFLLLIGFSIMTLAIMPVIPEHVRDKPGEHAAALEKMGRMRLMIPIALTLFTIVLFQGSNMAVAAFAIPLGEHYGLAIADVSKALAASGWVAMSGAALVVLITTKFGRTAPFLIGMTVLIAATWMFHQSASLTVYFLACCVSGVAWAFTVCYLMGACAAMDASGRSATLAGLFSKLGLATGPLVGGFILNDQNYSLLITASVVVLVAAVVPGVIATMIADRRERDTVSQLRKIKDLEKCRAPIA